MENTLQTRFIREKQEQEQPSFFTRCLDFFWPRFCTSCQQLLDQKNSSCFCKDCIKTLLPIEYACPLCALPCQEAENSTFSSCIDCQRIQPAFQKVTACYRYGGAISSALIQLKWNKRNDLSSSLGNLLSKKLKERSSHCDLIIPVPIHSSRLFQREYNQVALLVNAATHFENIQTPISYQALYRRTSNSFMKKKSPQERMEEVQHAFHIRQFLKRKIAHKKILLIDDVLTTGSTAQACTLALLEAGAKSVEILVLCRAT